MGYELVGPRFFSRFAIRNKKSRKKAEEDLDIDIWITNMKVSSICLYTALAATLDNGLAFAPAPSTRRANTAVHVVDDQAAQALSDYMAKSHVEKLKAIKEVEAKKNGEIEVSIG